MGPTPDVYAACTNTVQSYGLMAGAMANYLGGTDTGQLYNDASAVEQDLTLLAEQGISANGLSANMQVYGQQGASWAGQIAMLAQQNGDVRQAGSAPQGLVTALETDCATSWAQTFP